MIIKSLTSLENRIAKRVRDFVHSEGVEPVHFVPFGLDGLFIIREEETEELMVIAMDREGNELDIVLGFNYLEECLEYARVVAEEAELPEGAIEVEEEPFYIVSIIKNPASGLYEVYTQGISQLKELGSFRTLRAASEQAEHFAASYDCPIVEIIDRSRPLMRYI